MSLPGIEITILNGGLGKAPSTDDGIAGMILSGVGTAGIAVGAPKKITSVKEAELLGITIQYDADNDTDTYQQIVQFYDAAGVGATLYVILVAKTATMTDVVSVNGGAAVDLLNYAEGAIRLLGISRYPVEVYTPDLSEGIDGDVLTAIPLVQQLAEHYTSQKMPFRVIIGGRGFTGEEAALRDLTQSSYNRVGVMLGATGAGSSQAAVGLLLGKLAGIPVQRLIGRVADGELPLNVGALTDGDTVFGRQAVLDNIVQKGYIVYMKHPQRNGVYFADDWTATNEMDDYNRISRGRVIDKAVLIAYQTYLDSVNDEVPISNGVLAPGFVKGMEAEMEDAINLTMTSKGEISSVSVSIDPEQNILATELLQVEMKIEPVGYMRIIAISIGFENPFNS